MSVFPNEKSYKVKLTYTKTKDRRDRHYVYETIVGAVDMKSAWKNAMFLAGCENCYNRHVTYVTEI